MQAVGRSAGDSKKRLHRMGADPLAISYSSHGSSVFL